MFKVLRLDMIILIINMNEFMLFVKKKNLIKDLFLF